MISLSYGGGFMIGSKIKLRRQELGKSQTDLAKEVGISKQTLYKYETGIITNIPSDKIELLAEKLETSPSYLMGWEQNKDSVHAFQNYLQSLGYRLHYDDPEHKPWMITPDVQVILEYDTLQNIKNRVDTYASLTIDTELTKLKEKEIQKELEIKEQLANHLLQAAHDKHIGSSEELEKVKDDLESLKRPK